MLSTLIDHSVLNIEHNMKDICIQSSNQTTHALSISGTKAWKLNPFPIRLLLMFYRR